MKRSSKLVFFGNERLATAVDTKVPTLRALIENGYEIAAVIANYTPARSRKDQGLEIVEVAHTYHIPILLPEKLLEIKDAIKEFEAEAAVLVAYGKIIPKDIIDLFPKAIINIHPSLLPKYRGPTPIETTILDGASETGVSLMKLAPEMDAGPVYAQAKVDLAGDETKQELADKLLRLGSTMLIDNLPKILDGSLKPEPQNDSSTTYTKLLSKDDGAIDLNKPAEQLEREIRAYQDWPRSYNKIFGHDVIITKARLAKNEGDGALIMKANPGYLEILELIAPSGRTMSGDDFLRGYKKSS